MRRLVILCVIAASCGEGDPKSAEITLGEPVQVVPGEGLPIVPNSANNNLDVVRHAGRTYLAFRSAPYHWASPETVMHVLSSDDEVTWTHETTIALGTDVREPRFLSHDGHLVLFFALLGTEATDFDPGEMNFVEQIAPGGWTAPAPAYEPGFIPWRARVIDGTPYLIGYVGGENVYDGDGEPIRVHALTVGAGPSFEPAFGATPVVLEGGGSETDFAMLESGGLVAVVRNEAGDDMGFGSKICRAEPGALGDWTCAADKRKYDSPLVFRHGGEVYLIGRRHLRNDGEYDLGNSSDSLQAQYYANQGDYWLAPKRCALWRVDPEALSVAFVLDLPSRGDTCFASILDRGDGHYTVYNYTSPLDGEDVDWIDGQGGPTLIYKIDLTLP